MALISFFSFFNNIAAKIYVILNHFEIHFELISIPGRGQSFVSIP
jgi:hypothetical protein